MLECLSDVLIKSSTLISTLFDNSMQKQNCVKLIEGINRHVLPYIEQIFKESNECAIVPKFAANLCLFNKFGIKELNQELFKSFIECQKYDVQ